MLFHGHPSNETVISFEAGLYFFFAGIVSLLGAYAAMKFVASRREAQEQFVKRQQKRGKNELQARAAANNSSD